jgi:hypothetical protein
MPLLDSDSNEPEVEGQLCDVFEPTNPVDEAVNDLVFNEHLKSLSELSKSERRRVAKQMGWL